jgi:hypothetical protein
MRGLQRSLAAAVLLGATALAMAGTAAATPTTITTMVGPATVPNLPLSVCVIPGSCTVTPAAQTVIMTVSATVDNGWPGGPTIPPLLSPATCPPGEAGVRLGIVTLDGGTLTISGTVTTVVEGASTTAQIGPVTMPALPLAIFAVDACARA